MSNEFGGNGLYLARFFQVAYVARDLDYAAQRLQQRYGIKAFQFMRDNRVNESTTMDIALAWVGGVMIELIQSNGPGGTIYDGVLGPEKTSIRLHHLGHLLADREEWDGLTDQIRRDQHKIAWQGHIEGFMRYLYVDARAETGHYLEYILCEPAGQEFFDSVPRS